MVTFLSGNYLLWGSGLDGFRTTFDGGNKLNTYGCSYFEKTVVLSPPLPPPQPGYPANIAGNFKQMKFAGTFVGMIFHLELNELNASFTEGLTFEFVKTTNLGTTIVNTGVKCIVPGGETGFFYSNTNISEFTRTWDKFEFITITHTKEAGTPSFQGTGPGTLQMLLDLDIPPPP